MPNSKKSKPANRREYTRDDINALKAHSKARTPIAKISKQMKRSVPGAADEGAPAWHRARPHTLITRCSVSGKDFLT